VEAPLVIAHKAPQGSNTRGFVSVFFPGLIGCITAMNDQGVTVSTHDSDTAQPSFAGSFAPIMILYREAVESAHAETALEDIAALLKKRHTITGNNMFVTRPYTGKGPGAFVFEHDAYLPDNDGVTLRSAAKGESFIACSNSFFQRRSHGRTKPNSCTRFSMLNKYLRWIAKGAPEIPLTLETAWDIAGKVQLRGITTYHRVIFEPNKRLMHIAFPLAGDPVKTITVDVKKLLAQEGK
jgi:hypothetical protein